MTLQSGSPRDERSRGFLKVDDAKNQHAMVLIANHVASLAADRKRKRSFFQVRIRGLSQRP